MVIQDQSFNFKVIMDHDEEILQNIYYSHRNQSLYICYYSYLLLILNLTIFMIILIIYHLSNDSLGIYVLLLSVLPKFLNIFQVFIAAFHPFYPSEPLSSIFFVILIYF